MQRWWQGSFCGGMRSYKPDREFRADINLPSLSVPHPQSNSLGSLAGRVFTKRKTAC